MKSIRGILITHYHRSRVSYNFNWLLMIELNLHYYNSSLFFLNNLQIKLFYYHSYKFHPERWNFYGNTQFYHLNSTTVEKRYTEIQRDRHILWLFWNSGILKRLQKCSAWSEKKAAGMYYGIIVLKGLWTYNNTKIYV